MRRECRWLAVANARLATREKQRAKALSRDSFIRRSYTDDVSELEGLRGRLVKRKEHAGEEEGACHNRLVTCRYFMPLRTLRVGDEGTRLMFPALTTRPRRAAKLHPGRTYYYRQGNADELIESVTNRVRTLVT